VRPTLPDLVDRAGFGVRGALVFDRAHQRTFLERVGGSGGL
jgi:hypothetical protein